MVPAHIFTVTSVITGIATRHTRRSTKWPQQPDRAHAAHASPRAPLTGFASPAASPVPDPFAFDQPRDPEWYKRAVFYEVLVRGVPRLQRRRHRGPARPDRPGWTTCSGWASTACGCCRSTTRRCATAATTSPTSPRCCRSSATSGTSSSWWTTAHERGIRVIADLVMNHTSDAHPWFQESRSDPDGPVRRLLRLVRRRRPATRTPGSSSSTPSSPTGPSTRSAGSTTGTGSSPTSPT